MTYINPEESRRNNAAKYPIPPVAEMRTRLERLNNTGNIAVKVQIDKLVQKGCPGAIYVERIEPAGLLRRHRIPAEKLLWIGAIPYEVREVVRGWVITGVVPSGDHAPQSGYTTFNVDALITENYQMTHGSDLSREIHEGKIARTSLSPIESYGPGGAYWSVIQNYLGSIAPE